MYIYILVVIIAQSVVAKPCCSTLPELEQYATTIQEFPQVPIADISNPNYRTYYQSLKPGFLQRLLHRFTQSNNTMWNSYAFKDLLATTVEQRERLNLAGRPVAKIVIDKPIKLYVVGDIHGDFHAFVRILKSWYEQNIITEQLVLTKPDTYIVINGDLIDRGAHSLECIEVALLLMNKNPQHVFYIRGKHEDHEYWLDYGLKVELKERMEHFGSEQANDIPLNALIRRFFNTLPLALYVSLKSDPLNLIRISHTPRSNTQLYEEKFDSFFLEDHDKPVSYYDVQKVIMTPQHPTVKAIISTEDWFKEHTAYNGLGHMAQDKGSTAWSVVSSPELIYQHYYNFFLDAYAVVTINLPLATSTIAIWNHHLHANKPFVQDGEFNLLSGLPVTNDAQGQTKQPDVVFGSTMGLDRGLATMIRPIKIGLDLAVQQQNAHDGIQGHYLRAFIYNDDNRPEASRQNVERLLHTDKTSLVVLPSGGANLNAYLDLVTSHVVSVFFPVTGNDSFRNPDYTSLVHLRPTYGNEVHALMHYLYQDQKARRFLIVYQDDDYGVIARDAAQQFFGWYGITETIIIPIAIDQTNFIKALKKIRDKGIDAIGLFATSHLSREFLRSVGVDHLAGKKLFCPSFAADPKLQQFINLHGLKAYFASPVPNPHTSTIAIVDEYRKLMDAAHRSYDVFSLEGYIATSILIDAMQQVPMPVTGQSIIQRFETYKEYNFKGFKLTFDAPTRNLLPYLWINIGDKEEWIMKTISELSNH
jgi:ABC-type branched-subunit amino acid transport system substrate-binding protein